MTTTTILYTREHGVAPVDARIGVLNPQMAKGNLSDQSF